MDMLKVIELFGGVGCQATALENLGIEFSSTLCEIDGKASATYMALHGETENLGDITKVEHLPECDLVCWSFPCQAMSIAGKQEGMVEGSGTTSSLGWEVVRLLRDAKEKDALPEYLVMENVYAITNKRNMPEFERMQTALEEIGYTNSWACLNAKDYGIPQNRQRVFMVSSLSHGKFIFPKPIELTTRLKDYLEEDVPEDYYLKPEVIAKYEAHKARHRAQGHGLGWEPQRGDEVSHTITTHPSKDFTNTIIIAGTLHTTNYDKMNRVYDPDGLSPTIETPSGGNKMPKVIEYPAGTKRGYMEAHPGDGLVMERPHKARGTVQPQTAPTLTTGTGCGTGVVDDDLRIRYLSEREVWRLMGFDDARIDKAFAVTKTKTHRYKQAGNGIVVQVLEAIFKGILIDGTFERARTLDDYRGGNMDWDENQSEI